LNQNNQPEEPMKITYLRSSIVWLLFVLVTGVSMSSCSSGSIQRPNIIAASWQNPDHPVNSYSKLLVIFYDDDEKVRAETERGAVDEMLLLGAEAMASVDIEPDIDKLEDFANVISLLNETGSDALMTVEFVEFKEGYRGTSDGFTAAWLVAAAIDDNLRRAVWGASIVDRTASDLASMEVSLWDAASGMKVWTATTDIQTYDDNKRDSKKFADVVIEEMKVLGYL